MLFPKPVRQRNRKAIEKARKGYCEWCGAENVYIEVHHIVSRGAGGRDCELNMISLCDGPMTNDCHGRAHDGKITKEELRRAK